MQSSIGSAAGPAGNLGCDRTRTFASGLGSLGSAKRDYYTPYLRITRSGMRANGSDHVSGITKISCWQETAASSVVVCAADCCAGLLVQGLTAVFKTTESSVDRNSNVLRRLIDLKTNVDQPKVQNVVTDCGYEEYENRPASSHKVHIGFSSKVQAGGIA